MPTTTYDGDGKRVGQVAGGARTTDAYDVAAGLPLLLGNGARDYVSGAQALAFAVGAANALTVYHTDGLGSVRALTDGSGALVQTYATDAFGVPTASQGSSTQPFGFAGEPRDPTGLVYLRARYYDPATGRFMGRDPLAGGAAAPQSLNRYAYALDNPLLLTDPSGQTSTSKALASERYPQQPGGPALPRHRQPGPRARRRLPYAPVQCSAIANGTTLG